MRPRSSLITAAIAGLALATSGLVALAEPPKSGYPPDPPPHASKKQWTIQVAAQHGKVTAERATTATLAQPAESARVTGRFALELHVGRELLDRVRFNVPLMGDEPPQGNRNGLPRPRFNKDVTTKVSVRLADNPRAAFLVLLDRESGDAQKFEWPPQADGRLVPWKNGLTEAKPGDPAGTRAAGFRDGGAPTDAGPADAGPSEADASAGDAGRSDAGKADAGG